jgi:hypothetical protein
MVNLDVICNHKKCMWLYYCLHRTGVMVNLRTALFGCCCCRCFCYPGSDACRSDSACNERDMLVSNKPIMSACRGELNLCL